MRLLLDTHVALWAVLGIKLPRAVTAMIEDGDNAVHVGIASLWEIAIKTSLARPPRKPIGLSPDEAHAEFQAASFDVLAIRLEHLRAVSDLPRLHGDPFDRLLVATAMAEGLRLVTHDRALAGYGEAVLLV